MNAQNDFKINSTVVFWIKSRVKYDKNWAQANFQIPCRILLQHLGHLWSLSKTDFSYFRLQSVLKPKSIVSKYKLDVEKKFCEPFVGLSFLVIQ